MNLVGWSQINIRVKSLAIASIALAASLAAIWVVDQIAVGLLIQIVGFLVIIAICLHDFFKRGEQGDVLLIAGFVLMAAFLVFLAQVCNMLAFDDYYTRFSIGQITDVVLYLFVFLLTRRIAATFNNSTQAKYSWAIYIAFAIAIGFALFFAVQALVDLRVNISIYFLLITMSLAVFGAVRLLTFAKTLSHAILPLSIIAMVFLQFLILSQTVAENTSLEYTIECIRSFIIMMLYSICCLSSKEHLG